MAESKQEFEDNKPKAINKCTREGCQTRGIYGMVKGGPFYCREHASALIPKVVLTDVVRKRCNEPGCYKLPTLAFDTSLVSGEDGIATHCHEHAFEGMTTIKRRSPFLRARFEETSDCAVPTFYERWCMLHAVNVVKQINYFL